MGSADDVATALLAALGPMTAKKLEKLAYYAQAWHLAWHPEPLFDDEIQAWREGPVVKRLYENHRHRYMIHEWTFGDAKNLTHDERQTVLWVAEKYGSFTAEALSRMTHNDVPWRVTRAELMPDAPSDRPIRHQDLAAFYSRQQADPETAVQLASASAALEGFELDADWQETLRDVADGGLDVEALIRDEITRAQSD